LIFLGQELDAIGGVKFEDLDSELVDAVRGFGIQGDFLCRADQNSQDVGDIPWIYQLGVCSQTEAFHPSQKDACVVPVPFIPLPDFLRGELRRVSGGNE
tara:strand:- start:978 stop:1274 length:297 start_codon:yes stop_codon:yes gene_type:complete